jgi:SAM-dependent methyltransferase
VDYEEAVAQAPPGWRHFSIGDVARLPREVQARELARVPPGEPDERIVRALFWTLVYHLEPERWDELARAEPIAPELIDALPSAVELSVDVGAGSGRLTERLVARSRRVFAVEPSPGLRSILKDRLPGVGVIAAWAEALPLPDACSELTCACGSFGPHPSVLDEMRRVTAPGGVIALISPERPDWFASHGWRRIQVEPPPAAPHRRSLDEFFGAPDPPHELVMTTVRRRRGRELR